MVRPMVHSTKHYVQTSITEVGAGAVGNVNLVLGVDVADKNTAAEVEEGASVKAIYIERWIRGGTSSLLANGVTIVYKKNGDQSNPSASDMAALQDWDNKKNVLYTTQGLFNSETEQATVILRNWIKIPKGKQRFGLGDALNISTFASGVAVDVCGFATYKEYT